jgi:hypothetical protein
VDETGRNKALLGRLEHKSIQTDRVVLVPGPPDEIEVVQRIYRSFVEDGRGEGEIAAVLNAEGIRTDLGRPWTHGTVHQMRTRWNPLASRSGSYSPTLPEKRTR